MTGATVAGYALQLVGLVIAAYGLRKHWLAFKEPDATFLGSERDAFDARVKDVRRWGRRAYLRLTRRGGDVAASPGAASLTLTGWSPDVRVEFGPLPQDRGEAFGRLDERTRELLARVVELERARELDRTAEVLRGEIGGVRKMVRDAATGSAGTAAFGLLLAVIGTALQLVGEG